jgi:tetratricopeptide (TPR) repeat protein
MRVRCRWTLVAAALFVAGCSTVAPPPSSPSIVAKEAAGFHSAADAPRIADAIRQQLERAGKTVQDLSTPDLDTYSDLLLAAGRLDQADQALTVLDKKQPGNKATLKALALVALARGTGADARVSALVQAFPQDPDALNLKAAQLLSKGDAAGASAAWNASLAKAETREALEGLAGLALDAGKNDDARSFADRALQHDPDDGTWALHSRVMVLVGETGKARKDLDQAVALAPDDPWHRIDRARIEWRTYRDAAAAQTDLETALKADPGNVMTWSLLADVRLGLNQPQKAYDALLSALKLRPDFRPAFTLGTMMAFRLKDYPRAVEFSQKAAKDYPGEYAFPLIEGLSLQALGKPQDAKTALEKSRPRYAANPSVDEMYRFLLTPNTDAFLNARLRDEKNQATRVRLKYYQGSWYALTGSVASARAAFEEVAASTLDGVPEIAAARDWLDHGN